MYTTRREFLKIAGTVAGSSLMPEMQGESAKPTPHKVLSPVAAIQQAFQADRLLKHKRVLQVLGGEPPPPPPPPPSSLPSLNIRDIREITFHNGRCFALKDLQPRSRTEDVKGSITQIGEVRIDSSGQPIFKTIGQTELWPYTLTAVERGLLIFGDDGRRLTLGRARYFQGLFSDHNLSSRTAIHNPYNLAPLDIFPSSGGRWAAIIGGDPTTFLSVINHHQIQLNQNQGVLEGIDTQDQPVGFYDLSPRDLTENRAVSYSGSPPVFEPEKLSKNLATRFEWDFQPRIPTLSARGLPIPARGDFSILAAVGREEENVFWSAVDLAQNRGLVLITQPEINGHPMISIIKPSPIDPEAGNSTGTLVQQVERAIKSQALVLRNQVIDLKTGWGLYPYFEVIPRDNQKRYTLSAPFGIMRMGMVIGYDSKDYIVTNTFFGEVNILPVEQRGIQ